jgi:hypothetical protein
MPYEPQTRDGPGVLQCKQQTLHLKQHRPVNAQVPPGDEISCRTAHPLQEGPVHLSYRAMAITADDDAEAV